MSQTPSQTEIDIDTSQQDSWLIKATSFGNLPNDTDEEILSKRFLIYMAVLMSGGGLMWGTMAAAYGLYYQSLIPFGYAVITVFNMIIFANTRDFGLTRFVQVFISLLLPFGFQWALGGYHASGGVMLWALLSLVGSIAFQSIRTATYWLIAYVVLTVFTGIIDPYVSQFAVINHPEIETMFVTINTVIISTIVVALIFYFVSSRDKANDKLRTMTDHLEDQVDDRTRELNNTLAHLNAIIDNLADGLLVSDSNSKILRINPPLKQMFHTRDEADLKGKNSSILTEEIEELQTEALWDEAMAARELILPGNRIAKATTTCIYKKNEENATGTVTLIRDITKEKEIDSMKTEFISNVSHELRTPLTSVLGFAKLIQKRFTDVVQPQLNLEDKKTARANKQIIENISIIGTEATRLTTLINSLLDIAKMEAGKTEWVDEDFDVYSVVDQSVKSASALVQGKPSIQLDVDIDDELLPVRGDRERIIQVILNLLSNAIKFTEEGQINFKVRNIGRFIEFRVKDRGIGISPEFHEKVFDKFQQVGDALVDKPVGTGLGLPICKQIVEHHGGKIWVESALGRGSAFCFQLPCVMPENQISIPDKKDLYIRETDLESLIHDLESHREDKSANGTKTVLITDDDEAIRTMLKQELKEKGYNTLEAADGVEAIQLLKRENIHLVILDIMMPKMNGFDVAAVIKNDPEIMHIPILVHSVVSESGRGYRLGVDTYLTKTGNTDQIITEVSRLIKQGASRKKVLVLDENQNTVDSLTHLLLAKGYDALGAIDPEDGLQKAIEMKPSMVIVDSTVSEKYDLIKTLRFKKGLENVYFLVLGDAGHEAN